MRYPSVSPTFKAQRQRTPCGDALDTALEGTAATGGANLVLTSAPLIAALAKLMVFGLTRRIHPEDVHSAHPHHGDKLEALRRIVGRYKTPLPSSTDTPSTVPGHVSAVSAANSSAAAE